MFILLSPTVVFIILVVFIFNLTELPSYFRLNLAYLILYFRSEGFNPLAAMLRTKSTLEDYGHAKDQSNSRTFTATFPRLLSTMQRRE